MNQFEQTVRNVLSCHNFNDCKEMEESVLSTFLAETVNFVIYNCYGRYYINLTLENQSVILDITDYSVDFLTCRELNPNKVFCHFNREGILHAYCECLTNVYRTEAMNVILECHVTIRRSEGFTNVTFISLYETIPPLQVQFRF